MTSQMEEAFISGKMERGMKENGKKANSMARVLKLFLMALYLMATGLKEGQMVLECVSIQTEQNIQEEWSARWVRC
jgi:hypothetical protein